MAAVVDAIPAVAPAPRPVRPRVVLIGTVLVVGACFMAFAGLMGIYLTSRSAALHAHKAWLPATSKIPLTPGTMALFTLLMSLAVLVVGGALGGVLVWAGRSQQWGWLAFGAIVGGLAFAVAAVWVNTRTLLVTPALMLEGKPFWRTIGRAWRLTRGSFWRLFGIALLVSVLVSVLTQIIAVPFTLIAEAVTGGVTSFWAVVIVSVGKVITLTAATTYQAAVIALLYIDVRMRREALDVELTRAATADQPA